MSAADRPESGERCRSETLLHPKRRCEKPAGHDGSHFARAGTNGVVGWPQYLPPTSRGADHG